jgi:hypothetical protein
MQSHVFGIFVCTLSSGGGVAQNEAALDAEIGRYRRAAYAESTKASYRSQLNSYLKFCSQYNFVPVPIEAHNLLRYMVRLANTQRPNYVRQYLNIVRLLHLESGHPNPLENNWQSRTLLNGIKRVKGDLVNQKLPITVQILKSIHSVLDFRYLRTVPSGQPAV